MSDIFVLDEKKDRPVAGRRAMVEKTSGSMLSSPIGEMIVYSK